MQKGEVERDDVTALQITGARVTAFQAAGTRRNGRAGSPAVIASGEGLAAYSSSPSVTAVSVMRFEKPHSLSYQDITRPKVWPSTLVPPASKTELAEE